MKADPIVGLREYLLTDSVVAGLAGSSVFGEELPEGLATATPDPAVVLKSAGGPGNRGTATVDANRVDVKCYGATPREARQLYNAVFSALKYMPAHIYGEVKLLSAFEEIGPYSLRDPDTRSPYEQSSWIVIAREESIVSSS